jgi:hypothetical protein
VEATWLKEVAALPVDKQVDAVTAKLKDLNPGFDGPVTREIEDDVVAVRFMCTNVTDISPLRTWPEMRSLHVDPLDPSLCNTAPAANSPHRGKTRPERCWRPASGRVRGLGHSGWGQLNARKS